MPLCYSNSGGTRTLKLRRTPLGSGIESARGATIDYNAEHATRYSRAMKKRLAMLALCLASSAAGRVTRDDAADRRGDQRISGDARERRAAAVCSRAGYGAEATLVESSGRDIHARRVQVGRSRRRRNAPLARGHADQLSAAGYRRVMDEWRADDALAAQGGGRGADAVRHGLLLHRADRHTVRKPSPGSGNGAGTT